MQKKRQFIPLVIFMVSYLLGGLYASAQEQVSKIHIKDLSIRDPYILADQQSQS